MRTMNKFHVIGSDCASYHVLLGRPWIHRYKVVPFIYHHFVKVFQKGKKI